MQHPELSKASTKQKHKACNTQNCRKQEQDQNTKNATPEPAVSSPKCATARPSVLWPVLLYVTCRTKQKNGPPTLIPTVSVDCTLRVARQEHQVHYIVRYMYKLVTLSPTFKREREHKPYDTKAHCKCVTCRILLYPSLS